MSADWYDKPKLKEIKSAGKTIAGWPFVAVASDIRLYYDLNGDAGSGFDFYAVEYVGCVVDDLPTGFEHPEARFDCVIHGWAAFDGVRHLYFGEGKYAGYFNYPRLVDLGLLLAALRDLELKHCSMPAS